MLTLLEQNNHLTGTFFSLQPSGHSRILIEDLLLDLNIPKQKNPLEYHTTIIYSKKPCPDMRRYEPKLPIWAVAYEFALFGPEENILVLRMQSDALHTMYNDLQKYEPTTDYPIFNPHITVAKEWVGECPILGSRSITVKYDSYVCCAINKDKD